MAGKVLHMIGNSHIDPVWFWKREEGFQEILSTFASALDRMEEDPDFHFTATSAAFYAYVEQIAPEMFKKIAARVREGRWELAGGWWVEPDCNLPCGEAFVRQGLYGQLFFLSRFGRIARIGANFDSFGHNPMLPQFLKGCGLEGYVFLRPQFRTSQRPELKGRSPLFLWRSPDGINIPAVSLPGEYTTWFYEPTKKNVENTLSELGSLDALPCCFGVGNHGGGPTKDNIHSVHLLKDVYPDIELRFSTLEAFFFSIDKEKLPELDTYLEYINVGCYSIDHRFKQQIRRAEQALMRAEKYGAMARLLGALWQSDELTELWKRLLFCQFHDTLGGTLIEEAREDALNDVGGIIAQSDILAFSAMQGVLSQLDLSGEGDPLVLFNLQGKSQCAVAEVELEFFCKDEMELRDDNGEQVPYQRIKTAACATWQNLGGRRRFLFKADVPAFGWRVYRVCHKKGVLLSNENSGSNCRLENEYIRLELNILGEPISLVDKRTGYEALKGPLKLAVWLDEKDSWGNGPQDRKLEKTEILFETLEVKRILTGEMRSIIRVRQKASGVSVETLYILEVNDNSLCVEMNVNWDRPLHQLRLEIPCDIACTEAEGPYCTLLRVSEKTKGMFMHRWLDIQGNGGEGLSVFNDGVYGFYVQPDRADIVMLRSAIYAQGSSPGWYNEDDVHHYVDLGEHRFKFSLSPHGVPTPSSEKIFKAQRGLDYVLANPKKKGKHDKGQSLFECEASNIVLGAIKKAENGDGLILRLYETDGREVNTSIRLGEQWTSISCNPFEIMTFRFQDGCFSRTNLLEMDLIQ